MNKCITTLPVLFLSLSAFAQQPAFKLGDGTELKLNGIPPGAIKAATDTSSDPKGRAFEKKRNSLINNPLPSFSFKSLDGIPYSNDSLKGKVTLVNIWELGCLPCMGEISYLNKLKQQFAGTDFRIISLAPHNREILEHFTGTSKKNGTLDSAFTGMRKVFKIASIDYPVLPTCDGSKTRIDGETIRLQEDCDYLEQNFFAWAYPLTYIVDRDGNVRNILEGFSITGDMTEYTKAITKLLAEK